MRLNNYLTQQNPSCIARWVEGWVTVNRRPTAAPKRVRVTAVAKRVCYAPSGALLLSILGRLGLDCLGVVFG